jgi:ferritin-like metal-binding protein YciE
MNLKTSQIEELLLQSLEHEKGGVKIYEAAVGCAQDPKLKGEWEGYLEETRTHVTALEKACAALGIAATKETPGRGIVRGLGAALVTAIETARAGGDPTAAQLVACECVVLAETKDHLDWTLLSKVAETMPDDAGLVLREITDTIEDQEDEHLYHTRGWCRELWIASLGLTAVLPPVEELRHVKTAMGAAHAEQASEIERLKARAV